jgi:alpha-1,6-mannosyltransferase
VSGKRIVALVACGATLFALVIVGLRFQSEDELDRYLIVFALQAGLYGTAVWLVWHGGSSRRLVLGVVALALLMRVPIMLAPPYLSTDIYRYIWDGRVEAAGFNPYTHEPVDPQLDTLRDAVIFTQIASSDAPTIYPPVAEAIFFVVTRVSESVTAMKIAMVLFELATVAVLARLLVLEGLPQARVLIYAWHPLPLWEFAGSGHIDAALIALCVAAIWASRRRREGLAGLFLAGATLTKFYPAILMPPLYRRWDWKMPALFGVGIVVGYLPFIAAGSQVLGFLRGYTSQEGFDAGGTGFYLLGLLRDLPGLGGLSTRSYEIGAAAILAVLGAIFIFRRDRTQVPYLMAATLAALFIVLVSPHYPWYFSWLIAFICFARIVSLLWLTNTCLLLYLLTDYVFLQSDRRLAIETIIYGPFAVLALVDLWYNRKLTRPRS